MSSIILDFPGKTTTIGSNDPFPSDYGKADFDIDKTALAYYLKESEPIFLDKNTLPRTK